MYKIYNNCEQFYLYEIKVIAGQFFNIKQQYHVVLLPLG